MVRRTLVALLLPLLWAAPQAEAQNASKAKKLAVLLEQEDAQVRALAIRELVKLGEDGVDALIEMVEEGESRTGRVRACQALGRFGVKANKAIPILVAAQGDKFVTVREAAVKVIKRLGPPKANMTPALAKLLKHAVDQVRERAAILLKQIGPRAVGASPILLEMMDQVERSETRIAMAAALTSFGKAGLPWLIKASRSKNVDVRRRMVSTIVKMGEDGRPAFARLREIALEDDNVEVRQLALDGIAKIGSEKQLISIALELLNQEKVPTGVWTRAVGYISELGSRASSLAPLLMRQLADDAERARRLAAIKALAKINKPQRPIVAALFNQLGAKDYRQAAGDALVVIGEPASKRLEKLLKHRDPALRATGASLLARIPATAVRSAPLLIKQLEDKDKTARQAAFDGLVKLGEGAVKDLRALFKSSEVANQIEAVRILGRIGGAASPAAPELLAKFTTIDPDLKLALRDALTKIGKQTKDAALKARIKKALAEN